MKKLLVVLVLVGVGVAGVLVYTNKKSTATVLPPKTKLVDKASIREQIAVTGKIVPNPRFIYTVGPEVLPAGKVTWVAPNAEVGSTVREGDPLVKFDDWSVQAQIDKAKADRDLALSDKLRAEASRDKAEIQKRQAKKAVDDAQKYYDTVTEEKKEEKKDDGKDEKKPATPAAPTAPPAAAGTAENHNLPAGRVPPGAAGAGGANVPQIDPAVAAKNEKEFLKKKAETQLEQAKDGLALAEALCKEAQATVNSAQAKIDAAEVGVTVAQKAEKPMTLLAPASGTIIEKKVVRGQIASPQATPVLFMIADLTQLQIYAQVGESDISRVRTGMEVRFKLDAYSDQGEELPGKVSKVADLPFTNPLSSKMDQTQQLIAPVLFQVTIDIDPITSKTLPPLKPGLTANVDFVLREVKDAVRVPSDALGYKPDKLSPEDQKLLDERAETDWKPIWVLSGETKQQLVFVKTGITGEGKTEIKQVDGKLEPGMPVIIEAAPAAEAGGLFQGKMPFKI